MIAAVLGYAGIRAQQTLQDRGPLPDKQLSLDLPAYATDPASDLEALGERVNVSIVIDGDPFDHVLISGFSIANIGASPVTPEDFHKPLSVTVDPPWKIVTVENGHMLLGDIIPHRGRAPVLLEWKKKSDRQFEAAPFLLNPGDEFDQTVYLTSDGGSAIIGSGPKLDVQARVRNMSGFSKHVRSSDRIERRGPKWLLIQVQDFGIIFLLATASLFLVWYLLLLHRGRLFGKRKARWLTLIVLAALLSYSAAESVTYWAFPTSISEAERMFRIGSIWRYEWQNVVVVGVHIVVSGYLYYWQWQRMRKLKEHRA